jgi:hypothetical protein
VRKTRSTPCRPGAGEVPQDVPAQLVKKCLGDRLGDMPGDSGYRGAFGSGQAGGAVPPAAGENGVHGGRAEAVLDDRRGEGKGVACRSAAIGIGAADAPAVLPNPGGEQFLAVLDSCLECGRPTGAVAVDRPDEEQRPGHRRRLSFQRAEARSGWGQAAVERRVHRDQVDVVAASGGAGDQVPAVIGMPAGTRVPAHPAVIPPAATGPGQPPHAHHARRVSVRRPAAQRAGQVEQVAEPVARIDQDR